MKEKHPLATYNFCVMGNRVHFAIRPDKGSSLSKIVQWLFAGSLKMAIEIKRGMLYTYL